MRLRELGISVGQLPVGARNEITDVTGDVFFGLSMSCSRCHNHKFDPIPQTDYFSLRAFFAAA